MMKKVLFLFIPIWMCLGCAKEAPIATKGVLYLQDGVIDRPAGIRLDGEWEFYWLKYLTNCESNDAPDAFIPVPSVWNSHMIASNPIPVQGFATYRLKIVSDKPIGDVAFFFRDMSTAFRFYVDGKLLIQNGVPGTNRETTLEQYLPTARSVSISGNQAELIVQCANYEYCKSGLWNSIEMGRPEFVESAFKNFIYVDIFLIGGLLIMSIYHFGLYALRRRDLSPLIFGWFCLDIAIRSSVTAGVLITQLFPGFPWELQVRLEFLTFYLGLGLFFSFFFDIYRKYFHQVSFWIVNGTVFVFALSALITPVSFFTATVIPFEVISIIVASYVVLNLIRAAKHKAEGAVLMLCGFGFFFLTAVNDILFANLVFTLFGYIISSGMVVFILFQSLLLSIRFSQSLETVENLTANLERKVKERTEALFEALNELEHDRGELKRKTEFIQSELRMAHKIQMSLIPYQSPFPNIAFYYKPMEEVGGDFFDLIAFNDPNQIGIFISDVSGHGVPAAFITLMLKSTIAQIGSFIDDPAQMMMVLNDMLFNQTAGNFVTAFYGIYNKKTRDFVFANAGHNAPYLIVPNSLKKLQIEQRGVPLGLMSNTEMESYRKAYVNTSIRLEAGVKLLMYTDGLTETISKIEHDEEMYSVMRTEDFEATAMPQVLMEIGHLKCREFVDKLTDALVLYRGIDAFDDDVCIICLEASDDEDS